MQDIETGNPRAKPSSDEEKEDWYVIGLAPSIRDIPLGRFHRHIGCGRSYVFL